VTLIDVGSWMASGDGFECGLEIGVGLKAVQIAGLDKRRNAGPSSATFVMTREQRVLPVIGVAHVNPALALTVFVVCSRLSAGPWHVGGVWCFRPKPDL
jgi:hypothetical protein